MRNQGLDGVRGLACLGVILFHFLVVFAPYVVYDGTPANTLDRSMQTWLHHSPFFFAVNGQFCVCVFFVMSGYVLTASLYRDFTVNALVRRVAGRFIRLYIPAAVSTLLAFTLMTAHLYRVDKISALRGDDAVAVPTNFVDPIGQLLRNLGLNTFLGAPTVDQLYNTPLWTMSIEFKGSMFVFLAVALWAVWRPSRWFMASVALSLLLLGQSREAYFGAFLVGSMMAAWPTQKTNSVIVVALPLIIGCALGSFTGLPLWHDATTRIYCFGAILLVWGVLTGESVQQMFDARPLRWLGKQSFSLYLIHQPIIYSLGTATYLALIDSGVMVALVAAFTAVIAASLALAPLFEFCVDAPSISLGRRFGSFVAKLFEQATHTSGTLSARQVGSASR
jgi:peptidoglycan/LPS O-acetylase OafA/YrhL